MLLFYPSLVVAQANPNVIISDVNSKLVNAITGTNLVNALGWVFSAILLISGVAWVFMYWKNSKLYSKKITAFILVGGTWQPNIRDTARVWKLGKGGFEILYLKKLKTWKIAYGGTVGANNYYFFVMPDGYWYNGVLFGGLSYIDEKGGMIPIKTTNPLMRGQYTSLETQIDSITGQGKNFWEKYGGWVMSVGFLLIAGFLLWLNYKQYVIATGNLGQVVTGLNQLIDKLNLLTSNIQGAGSNSGLVPV